MAKARVPLVDVGRREFLVFADEIILIRHLIDRHGPSTQTDPSSTLAWRFGLYGEPGVARINPQLSDSLAPTEFC